MCTKPSFIICNFQMWTYSATTIMQHLLSVDLCSMSAAHQHIGVQLSLYILCSLCVDAIPVCVPLHSGQLEEMCCRCFELARCVTNINSQLFMTNERNALKTVYPAAKLLLCLFPHSQVCICTSNLPPICRIDSFSHSFIHSLTQSTRTHKTITKE